MPRKEVLFSPQAVIMLLLSLLASQVFGILRSTPSIIIILSILLPIIISDYTGSNRKSVPRIKRRELTIDDFSGDGRSEQTALKNDSGNPHFTIILRL